MIILVTQHISIYFLSPLLVLFDLLKNRSVCDSDTTDVAQIVARLHGYVLKSSWHHVLSLYPWQVWQMTKPSQLAELGQGGCEIVNTQYLVTLQGVWKQKAFSFLNKKLPPQTPAWIAEEGIHAKLCQVALREMHDRSGLSLIAATKSQPLASPHSSHWTLQWWPAALSTLALFFSWSLIELLYMICLISPHLLKHLFVNYITFFWLLLLPKCYTPSLFLLTPPHYKF